MFLSCYEVKSKNKKVLNISQDLSSVFELSPGSVSLMYTSMILIEATKHGNFIVSGLNVVLDSFLSHFMIIFLCVY